MAKATKRTEKQTKLVIVDVPVGVTLELSIEEAECLYMVTCLIGGSKYETARRFTSAIERALLEAGIESELNDERFQVLEGHSSIYFRPYK